MGIHESEATFVRTLAGDLAALPRETAADVELIGFMMGALYALEQAALLEYNDRRATPNARAFAQEFGVALTDLAEGRTPPTAWRAGFFINSGLMRLASLNERVDKYAGKRRDLTPSVRRAVNRMKHEVDSYISKGGNITLGDAVKAAAILVRALQDAVLERQPPNKALHPPAGKAGRG